MKSQRGGFFIGLIVGLLAGLALALAVALYVTKVPVPFVNKVPQRTPEQDAAEAQKNKNWDPNAPLAGKNPARPASVPVAEAPAQAASAAPGTKPAPPFAAAAGGSSPVAKAPGTPGKDPATILGDKPAASTTGGADAFVYFVQAGAFGRTEDAEQQRAKLAMLGLEAKITEREQSGRTVYRVRVGPYDKRTDAEAVKEKLGNSGAGDSAVVRVQRP